MLIQNAYLGNRTILVTGSAGFIGSNLVMELIRTVPGVHIVGLDNMNDYYDVSIKEYRIREIEKLAAEHTDCTWEFVKGNIANRVLVDELFEKYHFSIVVNLAAQGFRKGIDGTETGVVPGLLIFPSGIAQTDDEPVFA